MEIQKLLVVKFMDMDFNYVAERLKCSYEDKLECLDTLKDIIFLANLARKEGILILEKEMNKNYPVLLKKGIEFLLTNDSIEKVQTILFNYIIVEDYRGKDFLKSMIIAEGIIAIGSLYNPRTIEEILISYFDNEFIKMMDIENN